MPAISARDEGLAQRLSAALAPLLDEPPVADNAIGLSLARAAIEASLERLGFAVTLHFLDEHPPIITGVGAGDTARWVGLSVRRWISRRWVSCSRNHKRPCSTLRTSAGARCPAS
jgi:hypothetical protein